MIKQEKTKNILRGSAWFRGFTLIELLVTVSIMVVLSSVIIAGYQFGQRRYALNNAANELASDFRKMQNMAMSGVEIEGKYCSVGLYLSADDGSYILYGNNNCNNHKYTAGSDGIIETVELSSDIKVKNFVVVEGAGGSSLSVAFEPPRPDTYINSSNTPNEETQATIILAEGDCIKEITITGAGAVSANPTISCDFAPPVIPKYRCSGSTCIRDDASGTFTSSNCDNTCVVVIPKYRCSGSTCIRDDANGTFTSSNCDNTCTVSTRKYRCESTWLGSNCVRDDANGTFNSRDECNANCP